MSGVRRNLEGRVNRLLEVFPVVMLLGAETVPSVVESRWRLLPGCGISRVFSRKERPPMKKPYTIVPRASTPSRRELADWLAKDGQLLVPLVELLE